MDRKTGIILLALLAWGSAWAKPSTTQVQDYFSGLRSLQANFVQQVYNAKGRLLEQSSGTMFMKKPGQFRWDYKKPSVNEIVADGRRLWMYDKELEQVTVQPMNKAMNSTPLALLSGKEPLQKSFSIRILGSRKNQNLYELVPRKKSDESQFKALRILFKNNELRRLELEDMLGQRTRISLSQLKRNSRLSSSLFRFTPPKGVDVIGNPG